MTTASSSQDIDRDDWIRALEFAQRCFERWWERNMLRDGSHQCLRISYLKLRQDLEAGVTLPADMQLRSADVCWSCKRAVAANARECEECGAPVHTPDAQQLRYLVFVCFEIKRFRAAGHLAMAESDGCLAETNERIAALRRKLDAERIPMVVPATTAVTPSVPDRAEDGAARSRGPRTRRAQTPAEPRRNLMEILLDPRSIQWLLASGGVLLVFGLVIWLAAEGIFQNKGFLAVCLGVGNAALLAGG